MPSIVNSPVAPGVDVAALPLAPEHAALLVALDRMLTVGSYYPPGHEKYREVSVAAHRAVAGAAGPHSRVTVEVTDTGLSLGGSFAAADGREARRLHKLLVPLDVALLEIDATVSAEDLHNALVALKKHNVELGTARAYRAVEITDLPESVRVTSRTMYVKMRHRLTAGGGTRPNVDAFDPNTIPDSMLVPTPDGQKMERDFLAVVRGIMQSGDPSRLQQIHDVPSEQLSDALGEWIPDEAICTMKQILDRLAETNSDPMVLESLIGHAQAAMSLVGDVGLVELVFQRLRKDKEEKKAAQPLLAGRPKPRNPNRQPVVYTMTREQLRILVDQVNADVRPLDDLNALTNADCMGICYQILMGAPSEPLVENITDLMQGLIANEKFSDKDMLVARDALRAACRGGWNDRTVTMVRALIDPMRIMRPNRLGWLWLAVWEGLVETAHKETAWPFLVNDLLVGLTWDDPAERWMLLGELTELGVRDRIDLLAQLEQLPALSDKLLSQSVFDAPAPLLYPIYRLLLRSSLSEEFGPRLLDRLAAQAAHPLVTQLLVSLGKYDRGHLKLYQAMLDQGTAERVTPALADQAGRYLRGIVTRLEDHELGQVWVPGALVWLGRLGAGGAEEVLRGVLGERRWLFFPVWPSACRKAALEGLDLLKRHANHNDTGHVADGEPAPEQE